MKKYLFLLLLLLLASCNSRSTMLVRPSAQQLEFMDQEVGAFFHFTISTFAGDEHGDGGRPAEMFNPSALDVDQWMEAAKGMGARYAILTARHEDGFCLWPTETTEYCVRNAPWKDGEGDLVGEFVEACRRHDILPGLYFSPNYNGNEIFTDEDRPVSWGKEWDGVTARRFADTAFYAHYVALEVAQAAELFTNYGPLFYFWMDHWSDNPVCRAVTDTIRKLQPECLLSGPDVRHPGTERGIVGYPMWNAVNTVDGTPNTRPAKTEIDAGAPNDYGLLETDLIMGHPQGAYWRSVECPTDAPFNHGGWFWHRRLQPLEMNTLLDYYYRTVGLGANVVINLPPDRRGLVPEATVAAARAFGDEVRRRFHGPVVAETSGPLKKYAMELSWDTPRRIDHAVLMEDLRHGQKIVSYVLEAWVRGSWQPLVPTNRFINTPEGYNAAPGFQTVGHKKIDRFDPVVTDRVRFRCLHPVEPGVRIRRFAVWNAEE